MTLYRSFLYSGTLTTSSRLVSCFRIMSGVSCFITVKFLEVSCVHTPSNLMLRSCAMRDAWEVRGLWFEVAWGAPAPEYV